MNDFRGMARAATPGQSRLRVVHLVDSAGATDRLWGKENVIVALMDAQRSSGLVDPELVTFTPGLLDTKMREAGYRVHALEAVHRRLPIRALKAFRTILADGPPPVLHTHEYKANTFGRLSRAGGAPMRSLVSTCHGWVDRTPQLDLYFAVDRWTSFYSNTVTVTDPGMLERFPKLRPKRLVFVQNAIADMPAPTAVERAAARGRLGLPDGALVLGSLGRLTKNKGILDILEAARRTQDSGIVWALAGSGGLSDAVAHSGLANLRFVGYQDSPSYLAALDVYLQASYFEGLSMSLLESMRAALPSLSTRAGATELAVRDRREALLVDAGNIDAIVAAAVELRADPALRATLGSGARARFDEAFTIDRQHAAFMALYLGGAA